MIKHLGHFISSLTIVLTLLSCNPEDETIVQPEANLPEVSSLDATPHSCGAENVHNPDLNYGQLTDQEGNEYKTIVIGAQEWMAENLKTGIYRNGEPIETGLTDGDWYWSYNGAWCQYNDDASNECPYGKLYNWWACVDPRELCPTGWHIPNDTEFDILIETLDSVSNTIVNNNNAGGKMKTTGTLEDGDGLWEGPNEGADNSSGFSIVPAGLKNLNGSFTHQGTTGFLWTSTEVPAPNATPNAWYRYCQNGTNTLIKLQNSKQFGLSVRCVRD